MSLKLRTKRLQRFLNERFDAGLDEDGSFGTQTMGALEKVFDFDQIMGPARAGLAAEFDDRTERNLATLDLRAAPELRRLVQLAMQVASDSGVSVKVISGHRTFEEQDRLFAQGRTKPGQIVTNARGGFSNHNFGIAVDLGVFRGDVYLDGSKKAADVKVAETVHRAIAGQVKGAGLNTDWGGKFTGFVDLPHHEFHTGLTLAQKRARYLEVGTVFD